jgi:hypothetical protein
MGDEQTPNASARRLSASERACADRAARYARKQTLRQWVRVDTTEQEQLKAFHPDATAGLVDKALKTLRLDARNSEAQILKAWSHLIDPTLTAHAQPVGIRKGTLFVNVDNSVWLSEIVRYRRHEILERLQHCFGKEMVQRISFRIG